MSLDEDESQVLYTKLPLKTISDLIKDTAGNGFESSNEFKKTLCDCGTEFLCFVFSEAVDQRKRKRVSPDDVFAALRKLGFDSYAEMVEKEL